MTTRAGTDAGIATIATTARPKDTSTSVGAKVSYVRNNVWELMPVWQQSRQAYIGTRALHADVQSFIPMHPKEKAPDYQRRSRFAEFYNAYGRTVRAIVGQPFAKACKLGDDVPERMRGHWENIDGQGTHGDVFVQRWFHEGILLGCSGVLVDAPNTPKGLNRKQQEQFDIRPYWVRYMPEDVINWRFTQQLGKKVLTLLVLKEQAEEPTSEFGEEHTTRYRVYRRFDSKQKTERGDSTITVQTYVESKNSRGVTQYNPEGEQIAIVNLTRIPFQPMLLGMPTSEMTALPTLLDLLDSNLGHFRVSTDRRYLMHLGCVPLPVRKGYQKLNGGKPAAPGEDPGPRTQAFSINTLMDLPIDGDFFWAEITGSAFEPTEIELKQIELHMAALGLAFLATDTRSAETAEAKRLDSAAQNATLASSVRLMDDSVEMCLSFHAEYMKLAKPAKNKELYGGSFESSREYESTIMDPAIMQTYLQMKLAGVFTLETLWDLLAAGNRLPAGFDKKKEKQNLVLERPTVSLPDDDQIDGDDEPDPDEPPEERKGRAPAMRVPPRNAARAKAREDARNGTKKGKPAPKRKRKRDDDELDAAA